METVLKKIKDFADKAHGSQTRKYTPEPYIVHPVRVMGICKEYSGKLTVLAAALLHDVLEDTELEKEDIRDFLNGLVDPGTARQIVQLVEELTDVYVKPAYPQWNRRKRKAKEMERLSAVSADAQLIKYADIIDNSNEIVEHDPDFAGRFLQECRTLLKKINKGNSRLYQRAVAAVDNNLFRLKEVIQQQ